MLLKEGAIEEHVVGNLLAWPHTGFGAHLSQEIPPDAKTPATVACYMTRPPISPDRMLGGASNARVIYRSDIVYPRHQATFRVFDPVDFLAEVSTHIPDPHEKTTLFYGWYSNRTRGYRKHHDLLGEARVMAPASGGEARAPLEVRRSWARLIRQVYEVDPLLCSRCGGTMKVIAVIERPAVACLPAGRSGRFSITWASPPQRPSSARLPIRRMPWPLSSRASGPTNRSLMISSSLIPFFSSRALGAGLPCMAPPSRRIRKDREDFR
jgi:hypothetical protein